MVQAPSDANCRRTLLERAVLGGDEEGLALQFVQGPAGEVCDASRSYDLPPSEADSWVDAGKKRVENALMTDPLDLKEH